jgi:cytochrome c556
MLRISLATGKIPRRDISSLNKGTGNFHQLDATEAREHADTISIMLMSFPHLFPAGTNQWKPGADRDPATDTYASPDIWPNFVDFYQRASGASTLAQQASNARRLDEFRSLIGQLRAACNGCHEKYMKTN